MCFSEKESIVYFAVLLDGPESGAGKKVLAQAAFWEKQGIETRIYVISKYEYLTKWRLYPNLVFTVESRGVRKLLLRRKLIREICELSPSAIYVRDSFPFPFPRIPQGPEIVLEVQTLMWEELFLRSKMRAIQSKFLDFTYLKFFTKFIFVSNEIASSKRFAKFARQSNFRVISNGINLETTPKIDRLPSKNPKEFIFLGQNGQSWHGVEQILELARVMPDFVFNVVGVTDKFRNVPKNVLFHGVLSQAEYLPIAERCVVGIGTLNLGVKGMTEGSSIKVREYLALGLPVFLRHSDTDFMPPPTFILELPNDDKPITSYSNMIVDFAESWIHQRVPRSAVEKIDLKIKESNRLEFILDNPTPFSPRLTT